MDLLLVVLIAVAMLLLALRGRRRRQSPPPRPGTRQRPRQEGWSFSRHSRQDWRYWRDLAILIGLALALLVATALLSTNPPL
ncbi:MULTISPECIES: hypothetical protein [unclassified Guyparkeria]|uniref:hypothetical protein n=1 Tax=unclassified Guyparkeria TaxID=2626246 RepID=UPI0012E33C74|nr:MULTISPECIES: hypothetical protein [unclassified Guyparkeria]